MNPEKSDRSVGNSIKWFLLLIFIFSLNVILIKNNSSIIYFGFFLFFLFTDKEYIASYLIIVWIYFNKFYLGLGYLSYNTISEIDKGIFIILILYLIIKNQSLVNSKIVKRVTLISLLLFILLILSWVINKYNILRIITFFNYYILFLFILSLNVKKEYILNLLLLFLIIAIIQIPVTFLQSKLIIPAATQSINGKIIWTAGMDDAASGTFGPTESPSLSWFLSYIFLFFFSLGFIRNSIQYLLVGLLFLIPYLVVDSKTTFFTTIILVILYFVINRQVFNLSKTDFKIKCILIFIIFSIIFFASWSQYYKNLYTTAQFRSSKHESISKLYHKPVQLVINDLGNYGKISGFKYLKKVQDSESPLIFYLGFGLGEYSFDVGGKGLQVQSHLSPFIRKNNGLNARSGWNNYLGEIGLIGILLIIWLHIELIKYYTRVNINFLIFSNYKIIIVPFIVASILYGVIYHDHTHNSYVFNSIWIITAGIEKYIYNASNYDNK